MFGTAGRIKVCHQKYFQNQAFQKGGGYLQKVRHVDIAQKLGVSAVTVHNALSGRKGVSDQMRSRILQAAKEMGYEAAPASKKGKGAGKTWKIGVVIAENYLAKNATYYWKMYQELALAAAEKHCYTMVETLSKDAELHTRKLPEALRQNSVDSMVVIGEVDPGYLRGLQEHARVPVVFLDFYDGQIAKDCVVADNFYGMYQMTELLFAQGIEKLAFVGSIDATSSIMDRYCGFMRAMVSHHKKLPDEWLIEDRDELAHVMPEAFVCNCDLAAEKLIGKLEEAGYRVPGDISVTGFDNFASPGYTGTKITTYEVNMKAMTKAALDKAIRMMRTPGCSRSLTVVSGQIRWKNSVRYGPSTDSGSYVLDH